LISVCFISGSRSSTGPGSARSCSTSYSKPAPSSTADADVVLRYSRRKIPRRPALYLGAWEPLRAFCPSVVGGSLCEWKARSGECRVTGIGKRFRHDRGRRIRYRPDPAYCVARLGSRLLLDAFRQRNERSSEPSSYRRWCNGSLGRKKVSGKAIVVRVSALRSLGGLDLAGVVEVTPVINGSRGCAARVHNGIKV
jgi:hypothetical protein